MSDLYTVGAITNPTADQRLAYAEVGANKRPRLSLILSSTAAAKVRLHVASTSGPFFVYDQFFFLVGGTVQVDLGQLPNVGSPTVELTVPGGATGEFCCAIELKSVPSITGDL